MAAVTEFGKLVRKLRIERGETMVEMSGKVGRSPSFLSAMETGKKSIPSQIVDAITNVYQLSDQDAAALRASASASGHAFRLSPTTDEDRELVAAFAAKYDSLSDTQREAMWKVLKG